MRILGISGSLRAGSWNAALLRAAATLLPPEVEFVVHDGLRDIPPFDDDQTAERPPGAERFWRDVAQADAVLIVTPEYNHSIPGQLKNALDWLSRPLLESPLRGKPVAVVGASTGMFGAIWAQAEVRKVLSAIGARPLDVELPVASADEQFTPEGRLVDPELEASLAEIVTALVAAVEERRALLA